MYTVICWNFVVIQRVLLLFYIPFSPLLPNIIVSNLSPSLFTFLHPTTLLTSVHPHVPPSLPLTLSCPPRRPCLPPSLLPSLPASLQPFPASLPILPFTSPVLPSSLSSSFPPYFPSCLSPSFPASLPILPFTSPVPLSFSPNLSLPNLKHYPVTPVSSIAIVIYVLSFSHHYWLSWVESITKITMLG